MSSSGFGLSERGLSSYLYCFLVPSYSYSIVDPKTLFYLLGFGASLRACLAGAGFEVSVKGLGIARTLVVTLVVLL